MTDKFICRTCQRVLRYSLIKNIGCVLIGGHDWKPIAAGKRQGYFGVKHEQVKYGCPRCGSTEWRDGYLDEPLYGQNNCGGGTH